MLNCFNKQGLTLVYRGLLLEQDKESSTEGIYDIYLITNHG